MCYRSQIRERNYGGMVWKPGKEIQRYKDYKERKKVEGGIDAWSRDQHLEGNIWIGPQYKAHVCDLRWRE